LQKALQAYWLELARIWWAVQPQFCRNHQTFIMKGTKHILITTKDTNQSWTQQKTLALEALF